MLLCPHWIISTSFSWFSERVFSVTKRITLAYYCLVDDWLTSAFCNWTYSWIIKTGRDLKNSSALLFYIWKIQSLNWWMQGFVKWVKSYCWNLGLLMPSFCWINWFFYSVDSGKRCSMKWSFFLTLRTMIHISLKDPNISDSQMPWLL